MLARLAGAEEMDPYKIARATFESIAGEGDRVGHHTMDFRQLEPVFAELDTSAGCMEENAKTRCRPTASRGDFFPRSQRDDGRWGTTVGCWRHRIRSHGSLGTTFCWSVWIRRRAAWPRTADELLDFTKLDPKSMGLPGRFGFHRVGPHQKKYNLTIGDKSITGAIWLLPGMADNTVGVALGYGRGVGRVGGAAGFDAYQVRTTGSQHVATGAKLEATGETYEIACTQEQGIMDGRPVVRECNADDYTGHEDFVKHFDLDSIHHTTHLVKGDDRGYPWEKDIQDELPASHMKKARTKAVSGTTNERPQIDGRSRQHGEWS